MNRWCITKSNYEVNDAIINKSIGDDTHGSGISFSHDGKKMFKTDYQIDQIHQWTLSTAFDPTSISGSPTSANLDFDTSDNLEQEIGQLVMLGILMEQNFL